MSEIRPASSAYSLFQKDNYQKARASLEARGEQVEFGEVQRELSSRWKELAVADPERAKYEALAAQDKARHQKECMARDREVEEAQAARRAQRDSITTTSRMRDRSRLDGGANTGGGGKGKATRVPRELTEEDKERRRKREEEKQRVKDSKMAREAAVDKQHDTIKDEIAKQASARLQYLLKQSDIFKHFGVGKLAAEAEANRKGKAGSREAGLSSPGKHRRDAAGGRGGGKSGGRSSGEGGGEDEEEEEESTEKTATFLTRQPDCIKFGELRHYQLEGLNWMIRLNENGINGILADEMGLGKTLQSISVLAYMYEHLGVSGPHIILVPKSTLSNWLNEIRRWCPVLRPLRFHGTKEERLGLVETRLRGAEREGERDWDVLVTTYEVANLEKRALQSIAWRYLIIDEAHRLKNEASLFSQTVRSLNMQHRLLLTGTPLQNNLHELWALLNFLLPDVFSSSEQFDQWFNLEIEDKEAKEQMIHQLHKILRPFMLRRLKADVEKSLPPKTETILFVGLSAKQKDVYRNVLLRDIDMVNGKGQGGQAGRTVILNIVMQLRKCCNHPYLFAGVEDRNLDALGEHLIFNCGKMVLLDKLLNKLKDRGHRVLLFTQMTRMLDIFEDFCFMRRYEYCRIDGNTSYECREDCIDAYNKPNSTKFVFMLSTRAGGLGINLQTADTVILYDSDWNPQADLQAMDRAHRIGQKRTVNVYRLVTENTVEEKVVERAQQKLKLDAMIVQQGRLTDNAKKLGKQDLLEVLRFGADQVFRSKDTSITDADIDAILEKGQERTKALLEAKLQVADKGDLLDFSLDGGMRTQVYEGVDYSNKANRADGGGGAVPFQFLDTGKRERKKISSYKEDAFYRQAQTTTSKKRTKIPKHLRLPRMEECQFYNRKRLEELHAQEESLFLQAKAEGNVPSDLSSYEPLPEPLLSEKRQLLAEGFGDWTKQQYMLFVRASAKHGRAAYDKIAAEIGKTEEETERYAKVFWKKGAEAFTPGEWERHVKNIEKGERKIDEINRLMGATKSFISKFANPWEQLTFQYTGVQGKVFNAHEDRYLLCLAHKYGYGSWDQVKAAIRRSDRFRFDYFLRSCSAEALGKRCEALMKAAEKEDGEWHRRQGGERGGATGVGLSLSLSLPLPMADRDKSVDKEKSGAGDRTTEEERRRCEEVDRRAKVTDFLGKMHQEARKLAELRADKQKLRHALLVDNVTTAASTLGGDANSADGKGGVKVIGDNVDRQLTFLAAQSQGSSSTCGVRQHGSQAKSVPEYLLGELSRFTCRSGSKGIDKLVMEFTALHPETSKRQVEKKIQELARKEKRGGDARDSWYMREEFAYLLEEGLDDSPTPSNGSMSTPIGVSSTGGSSKRKGGESTGGKTKSKSRKDSKGSLSSSSSSKKRTKSTKSISIYTDSQERHDRGATSPYNFFSGGKREEGDEHQRPAEEDSVDGTERFHKGGWAGGHLDGDDGGGNGTSKGKRKASASASTSGDGFTIPKRKKSESTSHSRGNSLSQ